LLDKQMLTAILYTTNEGRELFGVSKNGKHLFEFDFGFCCGM